MNPQDTQKQIPEFELDAVNKIWWPVTVEIPFDGGTLAKFQFEAEFNVLAETEYDAILGEKPESEKLVSVILVENYEKLRKIVTNWRKIKRGGVAVPFSEMALHDEITGKHGRALSTGIWAALTQIRYGVVVGNFEPLPGTGQQAAPAAEEPTL